MMTPQKIQDLADPIESIYIAMTNELLVNIGKHVSSPTWTHTAAWEIQKLSELGQLTAENAAIINKYIKAMPQEIRDTMEETRREALDQIEKQLDKAAKKGYVTPPERDSTVDVLAEYSQQAANKLNLVNTTMLQSSVEQYERLVALTDAEYLRLMGQREATQEILNQAAGNVAVGVETRKTALQRAIRRISEEGLTGFYDKAGRSWSPEAYVNMDIRTTVHNVAIQSVKNRMADYNTTVFQVSAHAGARPLCYPYQGKLYSWDNTEGDIEIGTGSTMHYKPINSTSYGQPAGLFGINCGHSPIPIIPGLTIPHAQDFVQPKEENDKAYAESQEQRALEREIRAAKRAVEMGDDSKEAKDRVKEAQAAMREFIDRTGRTRRYDRESLYGGKPAEKTEKTEKVNSQLTPNEPERNIIHYKQAQTIAEAEEFARNTVGIPNVSFKGVDLRVANAMNESLTDAFNYSNDIAKRMQFYGSAQERNKLLKKELEVYFTQDFINKGYSKAEAEARGKKYASALVGRVSGNTYALAYSGEIQGYGITDELRKIVESWAGIGVNANMAKDFDDMIANVKHDVSVGWHPQGTDSIRAIFDHEFGHQLDYAYGLRSKQEITSEFYGKTQTERAKALSSYGAKNVAEFIAEGYSEYVNNPAPRELAKFIGEIIDKEAGIK